MWEILEWQTLDLDELTQQLIEQVEDVFPGGAGLWPRTLPEVGRAVVHIETVDAVGHQSEHSLRDTQRHSKRTKNEDDSERYTTLYTFETFHQLLLTWFKWMIL